ncbi:hypothetical protein BRADI_3g08585v3 [Brachypodium distachyon]|uniref:Uncharacterized protein n=1 Tax=Brachypodium distachyon TaxID=15368 RepID=A0A0Q3F3I7_BRADI|nr:hypothetical protein BRADI_3g08585v3 [Brachypodium distachyon]
MVKYGVVRYRIRRRIETLWRQLRGSILSVLSVLSRPLLRGMLFSKVFVCAGVLAVPSPAGSPFLSAALPVVVFGGRRLLEAGGGFLLGWCRRPAGSHFPLSCAAGGGCWRWAAGHAWPDGEELSHASTRRSEMRRSASGRAAVGGYLLPFVCVDA